MDRRRARPLALLTVILIVVVAPSTALAHTEVQQATPGPGAVVAAPVDRVELVFLDPVLPRVEITVRDPDGDAVAGLEAVEHGDDGRSAVAGFDELRRTGDYVVEYDFVAVDGDSQSDTYRFSIVPEEAGGGRSIFGPVALALTAMVLVGAVVVSLGRRNVAKQ